MHKYYTNSLPNPEKQKSPKEQHSVHRDNHVTYVTYDAYFPLYEENPLLPYYNQEQWKANCGQEQSATRPVRILKATSDYNLTQRVYLGEIDLDLVYDNSNRTIIYNPLPKYPSTSRDIALLVKKDVYVGQIEAIIEANGQGLVESYKLFDVYTGSQIADGYKSVAYSITYRSKDKTLTDEDVAKVHDKILSELESKLDAKLRTN